MIVRPKAVLGLIAIMLFLLHAELHAAPPQGEVIKVTIHDTIQPITAGYLERGLSEAARRNARAVIVSLGTPGGLLDSTRVMVQDIENSPVPVIVYISPTGSRAGSAGFFILESADIAAMAPGTNAGASHPILEGQTMGPILKQKIENDAAAFIRSFTERRGRNVSAAEDAVRNSKSYSDSEALKLNLIDLVSPSDRSLLNSLDGRAIHRFNGATETLHTANAAIVTIEPSMRERLLSRLTNPNLAVLLLVVGGLLVYLEFNVPGTIVPGTLGTLFVLLGLFGLDLLPIRHTAVALLIAAIVLMALETKFASHGILALAGTIALVFGLATLVDAPIPQLRVHLGTAIGAGVGFGAISFGLAFLAFKAYRNKHLMGPEALIGAFATARTPLAPTGQVEVRGELWQATLHGAPTLPAGAVVTVKGVHGLNLAVEPAPPDARAE